MSSESSGWEILAMARANCIFGSQHLKEKISHIHLQTIQYYAHREHIIKSSIMDIRHKLQKKKNIKIKHLEGGYLDTDFLLTFFTIKISLYVPMILDIPYYERCPYFVEHGLLSADDMAILQKAIDFYQITHFVHELTYGEDKIFNDVGVYEDISNKLGVKEFVSYHEQRQTHQHNVQSLIDKYITIS